MGGVTHRSRLAHHTFGARLRGRWGRLLAALRAARLRRQGLPRPLRLHVGCGEHRLEGWVNVDRQPLPGVDLVVDVTRSFHFTGAEAIYAEHFLEHLAADQALEFLRAAHRALAPRGWIRLTTPNLDWIVATHYGPRDAGADARPDADAALRLNRAFYGWQHQLLWNEPLLREALAACGFVEVRFVARGESELAFFRGIERHEEYADAPGLPHVLVVEARRGEPAPERLAALRERLGRELLAHQAVE